MNLLQALLAAVQCKPLPPKRNRKLRGNAAGRGGANSGPRNISGLSGTPSTYNGSRSSGVANRSGQRATTSTSSTAAASSMLVSNTSSNGLDTKPNEKEISFAGECIADQSRTSSCHSHPPGSILTANSSLEASVEDDIGILPERKLAVDGSTPLELISEGYTNVSERDEADGEKDVEWSPEKSDDFGQEHNGNEDEEIGLFSIENVRRLSYANISIDGSKQEFDLVRPPEQPDASPGGETHMEFRNEDNKDNQTDLSSRHVAASGGQDFIGV